MQHTHDDLGIAIVLLEQLNEDVIPKTEDILQRLETGALLDNWDQQVLEEFIQHTRQIMPLIDRHPEYQDLYANLAHLLKIITDQALINEKNR